jgi:hypothetical protein
MLIFRRESILKSLAAPAILIWLVSCATMSHHQFAEPAGGWETRTGQLLFRGSKGTLIGDVIVRFSSAGDFELNFSKGPGLTLLAIREDKSFAEVKGPLAQKGWSGPIDRAPPQLQGWLGLRDQFVRAPKGQSLRYTNGMETFLFRF